MRFCLFRRRLSFENVSVGDVTGSVDRQYQHHTVDGLPISLGSDLAKPLLFRLVVKNIYDCGGWCQI